MGATKRAIKTITSAGLCPSEFWPLAARHIGERRLRNQLKGVGWLASPMLRFGSTRPLHFESHGKSITRTGEMPEKKL